MVGDQVELNIGRFIYFINVQDTNIFCKLELCCRM